MIQMQLINFITFFHFKHNQNNERDDFIKIKQNKRINKTRMLKTSHIFVFLLLIYSINSYLKYRTVIDPEEIGE
jgi:hypothetical protein